MKSVMKIGAAVIACAAFASPSMAGTFKAISVDGDFSDWTGVPILITDNAFDASPIDIATIQVANDATNLYIRVNYATPVNPNAGPSVYLSFDADNNLATGYNIYGLGTVGADASYVNDFGFDERGGFNSGGLSNGAAISPYNIVTSSQEYSIPRSLTYTTDGATVFGSSFTMMAWSDGNGADATPGGAYTFALAPEPTSIAALAAAGLLARRRR